MGACDFYTVECGKDHHEAFAKARDAAFYDYGHAGYTGTIAEKPGTNRPSRTFKTHREAMAFAEENVEQNDKWGYAECVEIEASAAEKKNGLRKFLFFGFASE